MARVMAAGAHAVRECTPHVATCTRRGGSPSLPTFEPAIQLSSLYVHMGSRVRMRAGLPRSPAWSPATSPATTRRAQVELHVTEKTRVMAAGAHAVRECTPHVATCTRRGGSPSLPTFEPAIQLSSLYVHMGSRVRMRAGLPRSPAWSPATSPATTRRAQVELHVTEKTEIVSSRPRS